MKCQFCSRQSVHEFKDIGLFLCEGCGKAFSEGFQKGRVYESVSRREHFRSPKR